MNSKQNVKELEKMDLSELPEINNFSKYLFKLDINFLTWNQTAINNNLYLTNELFTSKLVTNISWCTSFSILNLHIKGNKLVKIIMQLKKGIVVVLEKLEVVFEIIILSCQVFE